MSLPWQNPPPGITRLHLQEADAMLTDVVLIWEACGGDAIDVELQVREYQPLTLDRSEMRYADYLRTPEWQQHREFALRRALYRCQGCADDRHLEVHHRTYENLGFECAEDLTVLCAACHTAVHLVADGRRGKIRTSGRRA